MAILDSVKATDAQKAKVDSIVKAYQALNAPLQEAARGGDQDAMGKVRANNAKRTEDIKAVLTDEQKAQFDKIMAAMAQRRGGPPPTL
jgi:Spy/CpxP family protein refolding chaperone